MQRMIVSVGFQFQGCTFRLHPKNRLQLQDLFRQPIASASVLDLSENWSVSLPEGGLHSNFRMSVFVSNESNQPFAVAYQSKWLPICSLLSDLNNEQLYFLDEIVFQGPFPVKEILTISPSTACIPAYGQAS